MARTKPSCSLDLCKLPEEVDIEEMYKIIVESTSKMTNFSIPFI